MRGHTSRYNGFDVLFFFPFLTFFFFENSSISRIKRERMEESSEGRKRNGEYGTGRGRRTWINHCGKYYTNQHGYFDVSPSFRVSPSFLLPFKTVLRYISGFEAFLFLSCVPYTYTEGTEIASIYASIAQWQGRWGSRVNINLDSSV